MKTLLVIAALLAATPANAQRCLTNEETASMASSKTTKTTYISWNNGSLVNCGNNFFYGEFSCGGRRYNGNSVKDKNGRFFDIGFPSRSEPTITCKFNPDGTYLSVAEYIDIGTVADTNITVKRVRKLVQLYRVPAKPNF